MNRVRIEEEVRRLSPWYYEFDLEGVSTTITPPTDQHGHRRILLPNVARGLLVGSTVLDVGCSEGAYTLAALEFGAQHVTGIDLSARNIEKARFVAELRGESNAEFHVARAEEWARENPEQVDNVFLCGLLHHLDDPGAMISEYCEIARKGVFVTAVLGGGSEGYRSFTEFVRAQSAGQQDLANMPSESRAIIREFERCGFRPAYIAESRPRQAADVWGGCSLYFRRCSADLAVGEADSNAILDPVELHLVPRREDGGELDVVIYNWTADALDVVGELVLEDTGGEVLADPMQMPFTLTPRVSESDGSASVSMLLPMRLEGAQREAVKARATVRDRASGRVLAERRVLLS